MTSIEQTGRNVEEATTLALQALGVTEDQVDVEILEEGSKGFLGLGQAPTRVRVTLKSQVRAGKGTRAEARVEPSVREAARRETTPVSESEPLTEDAVKRAADMSREILQRILDGIGPGAEATVRSTEDGQVVLNMSGDDVAVLIGKHGQTINAIQYLVGVTTNRRLPQKVRIIIDAEGYRGRREEALRGQALYLAGKVKQTGQEAVLEALHANERRIIHTTLANDPDVYTYSEGDEPDRRVVISPRK